MSPHVEHSQRLVALFMLGFLLFTYPLLAVFNVPATLGGIPLLYAYLFGAWTALIVLAAVAIRRVPPDQLTGNSKR